MLGQSWGLRVFLGVHVWVLGALRLYGFESGIQAAGLTFALSVKLRVEWFREKGTGL